MTVRRCEPQTFPVRFEYVGQTHGSKDVEVRARVTGIVEKRLFQEGAAVKAGQPLFVIDARPYAGAGRRGRSRGRARARRRRRRPTASSRG